MIDRAPDGQWQATCVLCSRKEMGGSFDKWKFVAYLKQILRWELRERPWVRWFCPTCKGE